MQLGAGRTGAAVEGKQHRAVLVLCIRAEIAVGKEGHFFVSVVIGNDPVLRNGLIVQLCAIDSQLLLHTVFLI